MPWLTGMNLDAWSAGVSSPRCLTIKGRHVGAMSENGRTLTTAFEERSEKKRVSSRWIHQGLVQGLEEGECLGIRSTCSAWQVRFRWFFFTVKNRWSAPTRLLLIQPTIVVYPRELPMLAYPPSPSTTTSDSTPPSFAIPVCLSTKHSNRNRSPTSIKHNPANSAVAATSHWHFLHPQTSR